MELPRYSSPEIMKRQLLIAIRLCGEIDDDASYMNDGYDSENGSEQGAANRMDNAILNGQH